MPAALEFRPSSFPGGAIGAALVGLTVLLAALLARPFLTGDLTLGAFALLLGGIVLLAAAAVLAYWTYALLTLRYVLSDTHLTIHWAGVGEAIPLAAIERVVGAGDLGGRPRIAGLRWPGYRIGDGEVAGLGPVRAYSAYRSAVELVYVVTPERAYLLAVPDGDRFRREFEAGQRQAATAPAANRVSGWPIFGLPIFRDHEAFGLLIAGLIGNLALFVYLVAILPGLPELLPIHVAATGEVDAVGLRTDLLRLPAMAFMVLASNLVLALALHARERLAAILCLAAGVFVQVLFWVAVVRVVAL